MHATASSQHGLADCELADLHPALAPPRQFAVAELRAAPGESQHALHDLAGSHQAQADVQTEPQAPRQLAESQLVADLRLVLAGLRHWAVSQLQQALHEPSGCQLAQPRLDLPAQVRP